MLPEHKNPIFVSKRPKISEKSPILTQECQFCARKAGKWGSRSQKAHKNADFVLGGARNQYGETQRGREQPPETGQDRLGRSATARSTTKRNRNATQHNATHATQPPRNTTATQHTIHETQPLRQRQGTATPRHNGEQQKRRQPFGLSPLKIGGYLLSHMVVQYHRRK